MKMHWKETDKSINPVCGVHRNQNRIHNSTLDKEKVTCRACIRWIVHITKDTSYFDKIYN